MKKLILVLAVALISPHAFSADTDKAQEPVKANQGETPPETAVKKTEPPSRAEREFDKTADEFKRQGNRVIRNIKQTGDEIGKGIDKLAKNAKSGWSSTNKKPVDKNDEKKLTEDQAP